MEIPGRTIKLVCEDAGGRLDAWLAEKLEGYSRSNIQRYIAGGHVYVNGNHPDKGDRVKPGDSILLNLPPLQQAEFAGQDIKLDIIYEDDYIIVVNKPRGMVVHPGSGNHDGTLANALAHHCAGGLSDISGSLRPGIVHRLDKDTSGLIIAAKTNQAHYKLAAAFKDRQVKKIYNAVVQGHVSENHGKIDMPIGRHQTDRKRMAVLADDGRPAVTLFKVVERLPGGLTWLEVELITGRTHQIRVHLAKIGHPVAGDPIYGRKGGAGGAGGMLLHSSILKFNHPITGERLTYKSDPPDYFPQISFADR